MNRLLLEKQETPANPYVQVRFGHANYSWNLSIPSSGVRGGGIRGGGGVSGRELGESHVGCDDSEEPSKSVTLPRCIV